MHVFIDEQNVIGPGLADLERIVNFLQCCLGSLRDLAGDAESFQRRCEVPVERLLVTDKQQPQIAKLLPLFPLRALRSPHLDRQPEDAAFSGLGFDVNLATHHIDEALCDRKAKAGSAITARHAAVSLREGSEKFFSRRGQDADTGIGDLDPQRVRHAALASEREAQANASLFRELDGI